MFYCVLLGFLGCTGFASWLGVVSGYYLLPCKHLDSLSIDWCACNCQVIDSQHSKSCYCNQRWSLEHLPLGTVSLSPTRFHPVFPIVFLFFFNVSSRLSPPDWVLKPIDSIKTWLIVSIDWSLIRCFSMRTCYFYLEKEETNFFSFEP